MRSLDIPLFVSRNRLARRKKLFEARGRWALDSGGFTELSQHGTWRIDAKTYAGEVSRYSREIGNLDWAAPQDWMCEPWIVEKTGLSVTIHQQKTVENFIELRSLDTHTHIIPVLQGWAVDDYRRHVEMYAAYGVDLCNEKTVGVGSVCRRQNEGEAGEILRAIREMGVQNLHGFGFKKAGIRKFSMLLQSADSLAWSYAARRDRPLEGCQHKSCANCLRYALRWREQIAEQRQFFLF